MIICSSSFWILCFFCNNEWRRSRTCKKAKNSDLFLQRRTFSYIMFKLNGQSTLLLSRSSLKIRDEKKTTVRMEAPRTRCVKVQRREIYIHIGSLWLIAPLKPFYVVRNLHVFYLDVQSAGSVGDDGQSVCELQAVLSALSRLLCFAIRLPGCLVSARGKQHCLSLLPPWFHLAVACSSSAVLTFAGLFLLCSGVEHPDIMYILHLLCIFVLFSFCPVSKQWGIELMFSIISMHARNSGAGTGSLSCFGFWRKKLD